MDHLERLARAHATLITTYAGLSKQAQVRVASHVLELVVAGSLDADRVYEGKEEQAPERVQTPQEPAKTEAQGSGPLLAGPGYRCYCSVCKADIFEVVRPIYGKNMGVNAFVQAFKSLHSEISRLEREDLNVLKDKEGNVLIDCPRCNGDKSLTLLGSADRSAQVVQKMPDIGSFDPGELGIE